MRTRTVLLALLSALLGIALTACGGGGGGSATPPPPPALSWLTSPVLGWVEVGVSYSYQLKATGGTSPYTYSAGANKPAWLTVDASTGTLSGTPTTASGSPATFKVTATDSKGQSITADSTLNICPSITLDTTQMAPLKVGAYGSVQIPVSGGLPPYTVGATGLPPGTGIAATSNSSVSIYGTATAAGTFPVAVSVTDRIGGSASRQASLVVKNALILSPQGMSAVRGRPYSASIPVTSGTPPYTFTALTSIPFGLTLSPSGVISGLPVSSLPPQWSDWQQFSYSVTDSDTPPQTATTWSNFSLYGPVTLVGSQRTLNSGSQNSLQLAQGGLGTLSLSITSGSLPPGMALDSYNPGNIVGTPTGTGTFAATVHAQDQATPPQFVDGTIVFRVQGPRMYLGSAWPKARVGEPYSQRFEVTGGTPPYTWTTFSSLPAGITFDNGLIEGTPTEPGVFPIIVQLTDSSAPPQKLTGGDDLEVYILPERKLGRNDTISTATLFGDSAVASISPYSDPSSSGPDQDYYRLAAAAGSVVTVDVNPAYPLDSVLEIVDVNGLRYKACNDPADDAPDPATGITADTSPNGFDDECMNDDVDLRVNNQSHLEFKVPGAAGQTITFYAHVFDWAGNARPDAQYRISASGNIPLSPLYIPDHMGLAFPKDKAITGSWNDVAWFVTGGTQPYTFTLTPQSAPLPLGLTLDPAGKITGTPTVAGHTGVIVQVADSGTPKQTATGELDIRINEAITAPTSMPTAVTGTYYDQPFVMQGGNPILQVQSQTWSPSQCCLVLSTLSMAGIPKQAGDFTVTYDIMDGTYTTIGPRTVTIHVAPGPLTVAASIPSSAKIYNFYDLTLSPSGGSTPFTFGITGTLPPGLSFNTATGELVGYPTQAGTYNVTLTTVDARSVAATPIPVSILVEP